MASMNSNLIPVSALSPKHSIPSISSLKSDRCGLLLGQERVIDAFSLLGKIADQHMYLADFTATDRKPFIKALVNNAGTINNQYLLLTNSDGKPQFSWNEIAAPKIDNAQAETDTYNFGTKNTSYGYLAGNISKLDLLGRIKKAAIHEPSVSEQSFADYTYEAGALSQCHYLFICADSLWKREGLWEFVFDIIDKREYKVHSSLPAIPLHCKIIMVGSSTQYSVTWLEETRFLQHFPLLGEMASELDLNRYKSEQYTQWLVEVASSASLTLSQSSLAPLYLYSARLADHQQRLSLLSTPVKQLLAQANAYSQEAEITAEDINNALKQHQLRHNSSEQHSAQNFDDKFIKLPTDDYMIGQINGLTVLETVEHCYGEPARITASVHYGDGEVADIERKSELGGNIHAKGMMILSSCLYRIFGKDAPLHLNANIVFEQSYQEIDGDSASLAEYCSLISAITEKPIYQGIAVTGAIDQFGQVQAIGGVNEKIEGFFNLCQRRGLSGEQGVIIPRSNTQQLNLSPAVIQAVANNKFKLYHIEHIDEAVELLMNTSAGIADENGNFPDDSVYGLVQSRLANLAGYQEEETSFFAKLLEKLKFSS